MIRHYKTITPRTAHHYVFGDAGTCQYRWLVLHGYGQLARNLISKFNQLDPDTHHIVAPEGLSRFYWEGVRGQEAASWMTSLDRLDEIADYVTYLDRVARISGFNPQDHVKRIVFGFSQGCATAWRWLLNSEPDVDVLIMWSGWLPEDMDYHAHHTYLSRRKLICVHGDADPFYEGDRFQVLLDRYEQAGLKPEIIRHSGAHSIDRDVLSNIIGNL